MANRETRRKQIKEKDKNIVGANNEDSTTSIFKTGLLVIGIFVTFYVFTLAITGNFEFKNEDDNKNTGENNNVDIQYDEILAGETFNMNYNEYFVLYYDFTDAEATVYKTVMDKYVASNTNAKIFTVDLSKGFNSIYNAEKSNPKATKPEDLKLNGATLIKIKNKANMSYSEGLEAIKAVLK